MNGRRTLWAAAAIIAVGTSIVLTQWVKRATRTEQEIAQMKVDRLRSEREIKVLQGRLNESLRLRDLRQQEIKDEEDDSEGARLAADYQRRATAIHVWAAREYAGFFRTAGLTPDQIEKFEKAVTDHWLRWSDAVAASLAQGTGAAADSLKVLGRSEWSQFQSEEAAALGPVGSQQLKEFNRTIQIQPVATALAGQLFDTPQPLTADEGNAITQILLNNSQKYQAGGTANLSNIDTPAVLAQAKGVLSPAQLSALQTVLEAPPEVQALNAALTSASRRGITGPPAASPK